MTIRCCDFCGRETEENFPIYLPQDFFSEFRKKSIEKHFNSFSDYKISFKGVKMFKFELCEQCSEEISNTVFDEIKWWGEGGI